MSETSHPVPPLVERRRPRKLPPRTVTASRGVFRRSGSGQDQLPQPAKMGGGALKRHRQLNKRLLRAVEKGRVEFVVKLVKAGADVDARDHLEATPLMLAAYRGETEMAKALIANGAHVNARDIFGQTALMRAAFWGYGELVELLIANGANVNTQDKYHGTAPMFAILGRHGDIATALREHGARHNHRDSP